MAHGGNYADRIPMKALFLMVASTIALSAAEVRLDVHLMLVDPSDGMGTVQLVLRNDHSLDVIVDGTVHTTGVGSATAR